MDTLSYMSKQMDSIIENELRQMEDFINDLIFRIEKFIKENGFSWTVEDIVKEYINKYSKGDYVSYSCKKIIENFKDDLIKSTGVKPLTA